MCQCWNRSAQFCFEKTWRILRVEVSANLLYGFRHIIVQSLRRDFVVPNGEEPNVAILTDLAPAGSPAPIAREPHPPGRARRTLRPDLRRRPARAGAHTRHRRPTRKGAAGPSRAAGAARRRGASVPRGRAPQAGCRGSRGAPRSRRAWPRLPPPRPPPARVPPSALFGRVRQLCGECAGSCPNRSACAK